MRFRLRTLLIVLALVANAGSAEPPPPVKSDQPAQCRFVEPKAQLKLFDLTLYRIENLNSLSEMKNVVIMSSFEKKLAVTADNLPAIIASATPRDPETVQGWAFSPYCSATFDYANRKWSVSMFRGGLGFLNNGQGYCGAFMYKLPPPATDNRP